MKFCYLRKLKNNLMFLRSKGVKCSVHINKMYSEQLKCSSSFLDVYIVVENGLSKEILSDKNLIYSHIQPSFHKEHCIMLSCQ
jgi:hypothetical protein